MHDPVRVLQIAEKAVREAGALMKEKAGRPETVETKTNAHDLVTEVDRRCEELISGRIREAFPSDFVLGEETVARHGGIRAVLDAGIDHLWIADPIDGTTNFVAGIPFFCASLAYAYRGTIQVGVIYHPHLDELFTAVRNRGAFVNGQKLAVARTASLRDSILATGFPSGEFHRAVNARGLGQLIPKCRNIRTMGSAALHLAYVAAGRITGFWENNLNPWDLAAGALLVSEAGGRVTDTQGGPYTLAVSHVAATNGLIHEELLRHLREASATGLE
ncbi:MAG: inositol monophosphatase family protein [Alicyclobacillaceae bacterium]|nr:inositol monophosphatase family protein [Alicyclobacillaceae bacterium]